MKLSNLVVPLALFAATQALAAESDIIAVGRLWHVLVDQGAGAGKEGARFGQQNLDAKLLEHPQRRVVDGGDLVVRKDRLRPTTLRRSSMQHPGKPRR